MTEYAVVLEQADDGGWWAYAPDLPGVISAGDSPEDARSGFAEALDMYRQEPRRDGVEPPRPRSRATFVAI